MHSVCVSTLCCAHSWTLYRHMHRQRDDNNRRQGNREMLMEICTHKMYENECGSHTPRSARTHIQIAKNHKKPKLFSIYPSAEERRAGERFFLIFRSVLGMCFRCFSSLRCRLSVRCSLFHFHFAFSRSTRTLFRSGRKVRPSCQLAIISYKKS